MSFFDRAKAEPAEPDPPLKRPSWYSYYYTRPSSVGGATQACELIPRAGTELRLVGAYAVAAISADVGNRYYSVNLLKRGISDSAQSTFYRAYFHDHIVANQALCIAHCALAGAQSWSVTGVPIVGEVIPVPDVWIGDEMAYNFLLGNIPATFRDTFGVNCVVQERFV